MELLIFVFLFMIIATVAGLVASLMFDVALRYGLFGRSADGTPLRVYKVRLTTLPIGFVSTYLALYTTPLFPFFSAELVLVASCVLASLIVVGIKLASMCCAIRRERRMPLCPSDNDVDPADIAPDAPFAPNV